MLHCDVILPISTPMGEIHGRQSHLISERGPTKHWQYTNFQRTRHRKPQPYIDGKPYTNQTYPDFIFVFLEQQAAQPMTR